MGDGRVGRFLLLVAPLLFGLLAMHAFVAPTGGEHGAAGAAVGHGVASVTAPLVVTDGSVPPPPSRAAADHGPPVAPGHHGADHLVHLCLAVLAAVGLAVAVVWVLLGADPSSAATSADRRWRPAPAERPPPVPRRLARLCVMRN